MPSCDKFYMVGGSHHTPSHFSFQGVFTITFTNHWGSAHTVREPGLPFLSVQCVCPQALECSDDDWLLRCVACSHSQESMPRTRPDLQQDQGSLSMLLSRERRRRASGVLLHPGNLQGNGEGGDWKVGFGPASEYTHMDKNLTCCCREKRLLIELKSVCLKLISEKLHLRWNSKDFPLSLSLLVYLHCMLTKITFKSSW